MRFLFTFLMFASSQLFAQKVSKDSFYINANLSDLVDGTVVQLYHPSTQSEIGKTVAKNKKFKLVGAVPFAGLGRIQFTGPQNLNQSVDFFYGNENIKLTGTLANAKNWVLNGALHQIPFKQFVAEFDADFKVLNEEGAKMQTAPDPATKESSAKKFIAQKEKTAQKVEDFVKRNPGSTVSAFVLYVTKALYDDQQMGELNNLLGLLTGNPTTSPYYTELKKEIESRMFGSIGSIATDFTQNDTSGKPISLSSFRGKYVLLDFWASWCGPCRMENPNVVAAYNKFKVKNFTVLGVSLDRPNAKEAWLQAIKDDGLAWTNVSDLKFWQNEVAQLYKIGSIPQNYLIDPNGKIVGKNLRGQALEDKLCELLGCN